MAKLNITVCDRCKKEIKINKRNATLLHEFGDYHDVDERTRSRSRYTVQFSGRVWDGYEFRQHKDICESCMADILQCMLNSSKEKKK